jgi:hypothetical protein
MKKAITILITVIFLTSLIHFSIGHHYCGGNLAAVKVSLTGEKATCGFEHGDSHRNNQISLTSKCCDDHTSFLTGNDNYYPEYFQVDKPLPDHQVLYFQNILLSESQSFDSNCSNSIFPPGKNIHSRLTQPDICVFRI